MYILCFLLALVSLVCLIIGMVKPQLFSFARNKKTPRKTVAIIFGVATVVLFVLFIALAPPSTAKDEDVSEAANIESEEPETQQAASEVSDKADAESQKDTSDIDKIEQIVKNVGDLEVTVWNAGGDLAKDGDYPYEVIVNSSADQISGCSSAKIVLYNLMHDLYTDSQVKTRIARVKFSAWGYLKASLGAKDAFYEGKDLNWSGPTNFYNVLNDYKSYEDESGDLDSRTWVAKIDNSCN